MIVQINNSTVYGCTMDTLKLMAHDVYPAQDRTKVDRVILLRVKFDDIINNRFFVNKVQHPEYDMENTGAPMYFLVLRYDIAEPYRVILMDGIGRVIVTDTTTVSNMVYPPDYIPRTNCDNVSIFKGRREISFTNALSYIDFINRYKNEYIHQYKPQDEMIVGNVCYTEYYQDLLKTTYSTNILEPSRAKTLEEIKEQLFAGNKDLDVWPDEILMSYPLYYNRRGLSYVDKPMRVINQGVIIRADQNSDGEIVVAETVGDKLRFITGKEAFIYTDYVEKRTKYNIADNITLIDGNVYTGE